MIFGIMMIVVVGLVIKVRILFSSNSSIKVRFLRWLEGGWNRDKMLF